MSGLPVFNVMTSGYEVTGDGHIDDSSALRRLVNTVVPKTGGVLYFPAGNYRIKTSLSFPAHVTLKFASNAILVPDKNTTIAIQGTVVAGLTQIFTVDQGTIVFDRQSLSEPLSSFTDIAIYPHWWGAQADSTVDTSAAFTAAMKAVSNIRRGIVKIPAGTYHIKQSIAVASYVEIVGDSGRSVLVCDIPNGAPAFHADGITHTAFRHLQFSGSMAACIALSRSTFIEITDSQFSGATLPPARAIGTGGALRLEGCSDCYIARNSFSGNGHSDIRGADIAINGSGGRSVRLRIDSNQCLSTAVRINMQIFDTSDSQITNNVCSGAKSDGVRHGYGIMIYSTNHIHRESIDTSKRNVIANNQVKHVGGCGIYLAGVFSSSVRSNTIDDSGAVESDDTLPVGGISVNMGGASPPHGIQITSNTITNSNKHGITVNGLADSTINANTIKHAKLNGIQLRGTVVSCSVINNQIADCGGGIINTQLADDCTITGNIIRSTTGPTPGIQIVRAARSRISHNQVQRAGGHGIDLPNCDSTTITDNVVTDASHDSPGKYVDLHINETSCIVHNNTAGTEHIP